MILTKYGGRFYHLLFSPIFNEFEFFCDILTILFINKTYK